MADPSPFRAVPGGLAVSVRLTPKAARDRIGPVVADADGPRLKVAVTEPPEGGKANRALIKLLAKAWRLPRGALSLKAGAKDRRKTLVIEGRAADLEARLSGLL